MILMLGPAGAGKSVQGGLLAAELGYISVSTGALLRAKAASDKDLQDKMLSGVLVSDELIKEIVATELKDYQATGALILDGFPRNAEQARWFVETATSLGVLIECMLHITIDFGVAKKRLLNRGRPDDTEEAIEQRFQEYRESSGPIIESMVSADIPIMTVDGSQSIERVHKLIMSQMEQRKRAN